jgi:two-component system, cell cycle sensor histidine kinase and response regulator CckA
MTTILVAEDDAGVRSMLQSALLRAGYDVLAAADGREALTLIQDADVTIDALVSDVNMPGLGGLELVASARSLRPGMAMVLASGTNRWELPSDRLDPGLTLLDKPFTLDQLMRAMEAALGDS